MAELCAQHICSSGRSWRRALALFALALFALALFALAAPPPWAGNAQAQPEPPRVLVLHSYHPGYQWTDNIQRGITSGLAEKAPQAGVFVEYMDTQRLAPERIFPLLRSYYAAKYKNIPPSVILASDDNAVDFLLRHRDELFPGAPVVFCGVNDMEPKHLEGRPGYTGVVERTDLKATIDAALALMPGMRRLAFISSATETGQASLLLFRQTMAGYADRLEPVELCGLPFAEVAARLTTLSPDTAILYMGLQRDPDGRTMTVDESLAFIRTATRQPVFSPWDFVVGKGAVGGVVVSGERQGRLTAEIAARILQGESLAELPVLFTSPSVGMFDFHELERFDFSPNKLPAHSVLLNRSEKLWERYWGWISLAGTLFALMAVVIVLLVVNIHRRRRAETQQDLAHRRHQDFVEALSVGVLELALDGGIVFANQAGHSLCGEPPGGLVGQNIVGLADGELARLTISRQLAAETCPPGPALTRLRTRQGGTVEVKLEWICLRGQDGRHTGFLVAATDFTELRQAERAREEQHSLTIALLDANPTPIVAKDRDGRYVQANRAMCDFVGLRAEQILGRRMTELGPPELAAQVAELDREIYTGNGRQVVETQMRDATGSLRDIILSRSLYHDAQGRPLGVVGSLTDITAQKLTAAALSESREKYRVMFENLPLAVAITDAEDRYLEVNRAFEELHGCGRAELLHSTPAGRCFSLRHLNGRPVEPDEHLSLRSARENRLVRQDLFVQRADGGTSCVQCTAAPLPMPGYGAVLAMVDVTEQRRTEIDLQQAKELAEAANNAKSDFMANVSHEIRTPLHGVLGMLQLLQLTPLAEDQADYLEKAQYSARSLLSVINDILDFSKIESGTLELAPEPFDPGVLVRSSVAVFEDQAAGKGLTLSVSVADSVPRSLQGDAGKIRQMVFNLVGNAVKFTDAGAVSVRVESLAQPGGDVVLFLEVEDTGVGIPEDLQTLVFEPFTQAEAVYTKRFQGTGLGLAIVRRLAALMDGGITLESEPGHGTRITLGLRLRESQRRRPTLAEGRKQAALPPLRLLLAEDNLISQMAAKSFLKREGHEVVTATNGQEALDELEKGRFDAVLMDIQMPVLDGVAATKKIRSHDGSRYDPTLPIIALTAYAQVGEHRAFLDAGMDEAISKPLEPREILTALARVLTRRAETSQPTN